MVKRRLLLITGMAGSGKTTLADLLRERKYKVFTMGDVIRQEINANDKITFYVKYGDYIGRIMNFTSILLLLITLSQWVLKRSGGIRLQ